MIRCCDSDTTITPEVIFSKNILVENHVYCIRKLCRSAWQVETTGVSCKHKLRLDVIDNGNSVARAHPCPRESVLQVSSMLCLCCCCTTKKHRVAPATCPSPNELTSRPALCRRKIQPAKTNRVLSSYYCGSERQYNQDVCRKYKGSRREIRRREEKDNREPVRQKG
jgi:hypothetical protein